MTTFDVCIVGGGIQGCGVAQAAAAAGYRVVLLERHALASATSSRSSKLIHGGLRYLESGQFRLVAKSIYERDLLLKLAPELVRRVPFYIPIYKQTSRRPWQIFTGLSLYALIGRLRPMACFHRIDKTHWDQFYGLQHNDLQAIFQYWDAQTDDARLTRAVMHSACELEAQLLCPAEFKSAVLTQHGYEICYQHAGEEKRLVSKTLINSAGPWVRQVQAQIKPDIAAPAIELVAGAHVVLNQPPPKGVFYVESPQDRRAVFIMPWYDKTMIGTTERQYQGDPAQIEPTEHEVEYLLAIARHYFPRFSQQIDHAFAGVRVLPQIDRHLFHRPRDTMFFQHAALPGYLAIMGGKLTGYRATSKTVIDSLRAYLPEQKARADTANLSLSPVD